VCTHYCTHGLCSDSHLSCLIRDLSSIFRFLQLLPSSLSLKDGIQWLYLHPAHRLPSWCLNRAVPSSPRVLHLAWVERNQKRKSVSMLRSSADGSRRSATALTFVYTLDAELSQAANVACIARVHSHKPLFCCSRCIGGFSWYSSLHLSLAVRQNRQCTLACRLRTQGESCSPVSNILLMDLVLGTHDHTSSFFSSIFSS
jgi:hypothetical protein